MKQRRIDEVTVAEWDIRAVDRLVWNIKEMKWKKAGYMDPAARGIAVVKQPFARGAERLVFRATEIHANRHPIGQPLVAKSSVFVEDTSDNIEFHRLFCMYAGIHARPSRMAL